MCASNSIAKPVKLHVNNTNIGSPPQKKKRKLNLNDADDAKINHNNAKNTTEDVLIYLKVDLLQLYQAKPQTISVVRNRLCPQCEGKGHNNSNDTSTSSKKTTDKCLRCCGRGVFPDEKQFVFPIQGCSHNDRIVFKHAADEKFGYVAGDIVIVLQQIPHPFYQREGQHLYIKKEIVLLDALCGSTFFIQHLDDRILQFNTMPGEILKPYQIKCIPNMGMPHKDDAMCRGHIFVQFEVIFPSQSSNPHMITSLGHILPHAPISQLQILSVQQPNRVQKCQIVDAFQHKCIPSDIIKHETNQK